MPAPIKKFNESTLTLNNRQKLSLTGVEKVFAVSETKVFLQANQSTLKISGENLEVEKLDVENGLLRLSGIINEIKYNEKKVSFFKRLFK